MMDGDYVEFCSDKKLCDMENATLEAWAKKWDKRINEHYLDPAKILNRKKYGFSAMLLICSAIEAIGTIAFPERQQTSDRFYKTTKLLLGYDNEKCKILYSHYRCGLTHNGRTNQSPNSGYDRAGEISAINHDEKEELYVKGENGKGKLIIINPIKILNSLQDGYAKWFGSESPEKLGERVQQEFAGDLDLVKKINI